MKLTRVGAPHRLRGERSVESHGRAPASGGGDVLEATRGKRRSAWAAQWDRHRAAAAPPGTTIAVGGVFESPAILAAMHEAAGGGRPRVAVVVSSKASAAAAAESYERDLRPFFEKHGFEPLLVPVTIDRSEAAHDVALAEKVAGCDAVYLCGGDQAKHAACLLDAHGGDTALMTAIRRVRLRGGVVCGSSAGAACQGAIQYGEGDVYDYLVRGRLEPRALGAEEPRQRGGWMQAGVGLMGHLGAVVCTHFDARARLARLLVTLRDVDVRRGGAEGAARALGIGLDEDTALVVNGSVGRVVGRGGVFIVDASDAVYGDGPHFSATGLRVHRLVEGDSYDFAARRVLTDREPQPVERGRVARSDDLLRPNEMTRLMRELEAGAARAVGVTRQDDPAEFTFSLARDGRLDVTAKPKRPTG